MLVFASRFFWIMFGMLLFPTFLSAQNHTLDFLEDAEATQIVVGTKTYQSQTDWVFRDKLNREASFRGWNVSGSAKLIDQEYRPFKTTTDAINSFNLMKQQTGSNVTRFLVMWEGIHPDVNVIDYHYLDDIIDQIKAAVANNIYVMLNYHFTNYSRYLFQSTNEFTGNGAPKYIVDGFDHSKSDCPVCFLSWTIHSQLDPAITGGTENFWENATIETSQGKKKVLDEFFYQMGITTSYIKQNLTPEEFNYILGIDPYNEPHSGIEDITISEFYNDLLWPFNQRLRKVMDETGWENQWVFAEPEVIWNTNLAIPGIIDPHGNGIVEEIPGDGFVFNSHLYDALRTGDLLGTETGPFTFLSNYDDIREEGRNLNNPLLISEYGFPLGDVGNRDRVKNVESHYSGIENALGANSFQTKRPAFYAPLVPAMEWHWDIHYNQHNEFVNFDPDRVVTEWDGWNSENFSVIEPSTGLYTVHFKQIERAYPRRCQGDIMHFSYNAIPLDNSGDALKWKSVNLPPDNIDLFNKDNFLILTWLGRNSEAPTEIYVPRHFDLSNTVVITDKKNYNKGTLNVGTNPISELNELLVVQDEGQNGADGYRFFIWDDSDADETDTTLHFTFILEAENQNFTSQELSNLQAQMLNAIQLGLHPVVFK